MEEFPLEQFNSIPSPRAIMRERRPYLFSDSETDNSNTLPRSQFEYHLETLTARKQEYEFEAFCRKLAEKELCPNLTIQTGPTGGGDGKTDAETYPVASEIAERWWIGSPSAGSQRWAFAFSAKKDWKPKLKADVKKIVGTCRGYVVICFITNQFASDKDKASLQDTLSSQYSCRISVFDRSWIVEKVYANDHLSMAIDVLAIEGAQSEVVRKSGPKDAARSAELIELDKQISDPDRYVGVRFQLASDCYRSAILARGLERPRAEIEARFEQAMRIADELGRTDQAMRIRYNFAWTAFWWLEDLPKFLALYDDVEDRLRETTQSSEAKHLHTLFSLSIASIRNGRLASDKFDVQKKKQTLLSVLEPLADDTSRPNNALEARTYLTLVQVHDAIEIGSDDALNACWSAFDRILEESKPLGAYPVELLEKVLDEMGRVVDSPEFDALYTKLTNVISQRRSDGSAGEANIKRAFQKLEHEKPYEAIRWLGRAEELLIKREYRDELTQALLGSSGAYGVVGLRWAARNRALAALDHILQEFKENGSIKWPAWIAITQLIWAELRLGRAPHALAAMKLAKLFLTALSPKGDLAKQSEEDLISIEVAFGLLILNLHGEQLDSISKLHDSFQEYDLVIPGMATLFSLGQLQALRAEGYCPAGQSDDDISDFLKSWIAVPGSDQMPVETLLLDQPTVTFESNVLGCKVILTANTDPVSVGIAESLLGGLECFMATSNETDVIPHRESITIVMQSGGLNDIPQHRVVEHTGVSGFEISYSPTFQHDTADKMERFRDWLQIVIVEILCCFTVIRDFEGWMDKVAGSERGFSRALVFSDMLTANCNVFGPKPPIHIGDHINANAREFKPLRSSRLFSSLEKSGVSGPAKFGSGIPPPDLPTPEQLKHTDRRVLSPIQLDLWNKAGWNGAAFIEYSNLPGPILALHFQDADAARRIFEDWVTRWGQEGSDANVRISIITGISITHPFAYIIHIGPVFRVNEGQSGKIFTTMSRYLRLDASTPENLNRFLRTFGDVGSFGLAPAITAEGRDFPEPLFDLIQPRQDLVIRPAWTIDDNDPDIYVVQDDDDPVIPDGETNPPIKRAMERLRALRAMQRQAAAD